jgi:hypothetical protein
VIDKLTWPQVYLMLDGAGHNRPKFDPPESADGKKKSNLPPKPDIKTDPIGAMRWALKYSPAVPALMRKSDVEIEAMCDRFREDIAAGRRVWSEQDKDWVKPDV